VLSFKPGGRAPAEIDQVNGATPPVTNIVASYGLPSTALGSFATLIAGLAATVIVTFALLPEFALEVAVSVTVLAAVGAVSVTLEIVSAVRVPPPATVQETPADVESPVTVALKEVLLPASIDADEGVTVTATDDADKL
jgi:hypothetical protein